MLLLSLLQLVWPSPETGMGFALGLTFATIAFREGVPAPKRTKA
jgi:hypothetical protein